MRRAETGEKDSLRRAATTALPGGRVLGLVFARVLRDEPRILLALDDSPTKRYGPHVQGAGIHHDPTPGPAGAAFCYGHVWVTLAAIVRHRWWGTIGLPIWSCCHAPTARAAGSRQRR